jgi:hypothetical protein
MPAGFTETVMMPGAVPDDGDSVSQGPPDDVAEYVSDPLLVLRVNFCDGGLLVPLE